MFGQYSFNFFHSRKKKKVGQTVWDSPCCFYSAPAFLGSFSWSTVCMEWSMLKTQHLLGFGVFFYTDYLFQISLFKFAWCCWGQKEVAYQECVGSHPDCLCIEHCGRQSLTLSACLASPFFWRGGGGGGGGGCGDQGTGWKFHRSLYHSCLNEERYIPSLSQWIIP